MIIIILVTQYSATLEGSHDSLRIHGRLAAFVFVIILDQRNIRIVLTIRRQPPIYPPPEMPLRHVWITCAANNLRYSLYRSYEKKILSFSCLPLVQELMVVDVTGFAVPLINGSER